jgi:hypothetical protein
MRVGDKVKHTVTDKMGIVWKILDPECKFIFVEWDEKLENGDILREMTRSKNVEVVND